MQDMPKDTLDAQSKQMPADFWNHPYNPITGWRVRIYTREDRFGLNEVSVPD
jgi:hypothetical protein|tara:strand:+ start:8006 stop:8161 length:156 start_codon:yes stop_codon:yes gene_type:complete